jgi:CBS domain-containing protein
MLVSVILQDKGSNVHTIVPTTTLADATRRMAEVGVGALIVGDAGRPVAGILSERDVVRMIAERGPEILGEPAEAHMSHPVITCGQDDTIADLMQLMTDRRVRHLPVVENGALTGIISIGDVVKARIGEIEREAEEMRTMIAGG